MTGRSREAADMGREGDINGTAVVYALFSCSKQYEVPIDDQLRSQVEGWLQSGSAFGRRPARMPDRGVILDAV